MRKVLLRADATRTIGVGHAMRLLALGQEFRRRGIDAVFVGALDVPFVAQAYEAAHIDRIDAPSNADDMVALARQVDAGAVVLDGYEIPPSWGAALRAGGIPVAAMIDADFGALQDADLYIDQNPGMTARTVASGQHAVAGADYTLFRDDVLALRRDTSQSPNRAAAHNASNPLEVLAVFGGTDPMGAAPIITPLLLKTGVAMRLTVISASADWANSLLDKPGPNQRLDVTSAPPSLAALAAASDFVVTASGSSVWEMLCQGVPIGVVCVADNQAPGYEWVTQHGYAAPVGHLAQLRDSDTARSEAVAQLQHTLTDPSLRVERARAGQALLDGRGRERVADAICSLGEPR